MEGLAVIIANDSMTKCFNDSMYLNGSICTSNPCYNYPLLKVFFSVLSRIISEGGGRV